MQYHEIYKLMKETYDMEGSVSVNETLGITIRHQNFETIGAQGVLSGCERLYCKDHHTEYVDTLVKKYNSCDTILDVPDFYIKENLNYRISIIQNTSDQPAKGTILLFHGLNEKKWDKYLPWAYELAKSTNKAVLLFPITFHMDRAPEDWSNRSLMYQVAQERAQNIAKNSDSSYVNAAISSRMESHPQRLFWSGLQSYYDIKGIVNELKKGTFSSIEADGTLDIFGYSIGSFLAMILMMSNPKGIFSNSKMFCFCGGMTIDRMFPISKYIMDARAAIVMQKCFAELLTTNFASDIRLEHYQNAQEHPNESWFKTMLRYNHFQKERETCLKSLEGKIKAYVLEDDVVAPPIEALNTLKGGYRNIDIDVEIDHYDFPYSHMVPFPLTTKNGDLITEGFQRTMKSASDFFGKS